jgi:RimJ/RimL family protein N-acetyltransferase
VEYVKGINGRANEQLYAICLNTSDEHIGNIKLGSIHSLYLSADIGLFIGKKTTWGKGYATEAIRILTRYSFNKLNLRKLNAGAYATNFASIAAFEKCGWTREGVLKKQIVIGDLELDVVLLGLHRDDTIQNSIDSEPVNKSSST